MLWRIVYLLLHYLWVYPHSSLLSICFFAVKRDGVGASILLCYKALIIIIIIIFKSNIVHKISTFIGSREGYGSS